MEMTRTFAFRRHDWQALALKPEPETAVSWRWPEGTQALGTRLYPTYQVFPLVFDKIFIFSRVKTGARAKTKTL